VKLNEGRTDRIIRIVLGVGILGVGAYFQSWWGLAGLLPLVTGVFGLCLLYKPFRISTRSAQ
jgi:hypothetical protein